jgi:hypothetical protein
MSTGAAATALFLIIMAAALGALWFATRPEIDEPPGASIVHTHEEGWNYVFEDQKGMWGPGYLTRRGAIRAARTEYERRTAE